MEALSGSTVRREPALKTVSRTFSLLFVFSGWFGSSSLRSCIFDHDSSAELVKFWARDVTEITLGQVLVCF